MTREEQILKLIDKKTGIDNFGFISYKIGVCDGVRLADETMIESLWHNVSEKPTNKFAQILYQDESGDCLLVSSNIIFDYGWDWYITTYQMVRWAYTRDLLPKGGKK